MGRQLSAAGWNGSGDPGEDRLAELISAGLAGQGDFPVDVEGLLVGARAGARRIRRRRRRVGATVLAVVIGVPVVLAGTGFFSGRPSGSRVAAPASSNSDLPMYDGAGMGDPTSRDAPLRGGTSQGSGDAGDAAPAGTLMSGSTGRVLSRDATGRYSVGDQAVLHTSDLAFVAPMTLTDEGPTGDGAGPTATPVCRSLPAASARAAAGRSVVYAGSRDGDWTLRLVVRVLPQSAALSEMDWLRRSMGGCASDLRLRRAAVDGLPGDGAVLGYQVGADPQHPQSLLVVGVLRQGRVIAGVELVVPIGAATGTAVQERFGLDRTRHLLALADQRLKSSRLVELAQDDPALAT